MTAYVLIKVAAGKGEKAYDKLLRLKSVKHADEVTGDFDIIALIEAVDIDGINQVVLNEISAVEEVEDTITYPAVSTKT